MLQSLTAARSPWALLARLPKSAALLHGCCTTLRHACLAFAASSILLRGIPRVADPCLSSGRGLTPLILSFFSDIHLVLKRSCFWGPKLLLYVSCDVRRADPANLLCHNACLCWQTDWLTALRHSESARRLRVTKNTCQSWCCWVPDSTQALAHTTCIGLRRT